LRHVTSPARSGPVHSEKGPGEGWQLARPLSQITLLAVYEALDRPSLFAIGNRSARTNCIVEKKVNIVMTKTMAEA
jgi:DNA-binding IscR family transcriptional regulator